MASTLMMSGMQHIEHRGPAAVMHHGAAVIWPERLARHICTQKTLLCIPDQLSSDAASCWV